LYDSAAHFGTLPWLVGRDRLVDATSGLAAANTIMSMAGTAAAGLLATTLGAAPSIWLDATAPEDQIQSGFAGPATRG